MGKVAAVKAGASGDFGRWLRPQDRVSHPRLEEAAAAGYVELWEGYRIGGCTAWASAQSLGRAASGSKRLESCFPQPAGDDIAGSATEGLGDKMECIR